MQISAISVFTADLYRIALIWTFRDEKTTF